MAAAEEFTDSKGGRVQPVSDPDRLLAPHRDFISNYIRKRVRRTDDAEDLTQEVFLSATRALRGFKGECPIGQWVLRIAINQLSSFYKRSAPRLMRSLSLEDIPEDSAANPLRTAPSASPEERAKSREYVSILLAAAKEACSDTEFAVLFLYYRYEAFEEIAEMLQMKPDVARAYFHRARGKLLAHLVQNRPDVLGGPEEIKRATEHLLQAKGDEALSSEEREALANPKGRIELFRAACVKLARYIAATLAVYAGGGRCGRREGNG